MVRPLVHFADRTGSAAERDVLEIEVRRAWLHPDVISHAIEGRELASPLPPRLLFLLPGA